MSIAVLHSRALAGMDAPPVTVEVHLANGLPAFAIVGLPDTEVKEAKDRVRAALQNARFEFPQRRITVNLAPADLPKESGRYDLAIALGILVASEQVPGTALAMHEFIGELALTGELRAVRGALPMALAVARAGRRLVAPSDNAEEAALVAAAEVLPAGSLLDVCAHLAGRTALARHHGRDGASVPVYPDLAEVKGQAQAKRVLELAAAGGHSLLMTGPPGTGKTMLASRLPGLLPPLDEDEALAAAAVRSLVDGRLDVARWRERPFRAPHHTASPIALVGGGSVPRPGEVSLALHGVLFLDELPEFDRRVLEVLREPLEAGVIRVSRAARQTDFPAQFQLVAAMNPCPCGYLGHANGRCRCTPDQVLRYRRKLSGPLMDRIDLHIDVPAVEVEALSARGDGEASASVRERVVAARLRMQARQGTTNALLSSGGVETWCTPDAEGVALIKQAIARLGLSARGYHRVLKVARTIADVAGSENVAAAHVAEALQYRRVDRTVA